MKPEHAVFGSSPQLRAAVRHAEELALKTGQPAVIYHRPHDESWFVLRADAQAPSGSTIKTTIFPDLDQPNPYYPHRRSA